MGLSAAACSTKAQTITDADRLLQRPRFHLSAGAEGGYTEVPQQACSDCDRSATGLSINALVRIKRNWTLGAGWSVHEAGLGHLSQYDTTVFIPAYQMWGIQNGSFVLVWVPERYQKRFHSVRIAQRTMGMEIMGGLTLPAK
ncbi:MAG TPA: hypothetical protein PKY96_09155 [Flavobacteriales bacterium]|nr:hypothetical protein [Flavobacteriales bacterium]